MSLRFRVMTCGQMDRQHVSIDTVAGAYSGGPPTICPELGCSINNEVTSVTCDLSVLKALKETALTRMVLPAPILLIPPIVMTFLER